MNEKELVAIATETWRNLLAEGISIVLSWGTSNQRAILHNNMAALAFEVQGRLFVGTVIVAYNEGDDLYEVYTKEKCDSKIELLQGGVYFDQLTDVIDRKVEKGDDSEEYQAWLERYERDCALVPY